MNYSSFEPSPKTEQDIQMEQQKRKDKFAKIEEVVEKKQWIKLQSIYYDMNSYYYDKKTGNLYKVDNCSDNPTFVIDNDPEILKANNLHTPKAINGFEGFVGFGFR